METVQAGAREAFVLRVESEKNSSTILIYKRDQNGKIEVINLQD